MALLLQDVVELSFDEVVIFDQHEYVFDILLLLLADIPLGFREILRRYFESFAEIVNFLGCGFVVLDVADDEGFQLLLRIVLADAKYSEVKHFGTLLDLIGVRFDWAVRAVIGWVDNVHLLSINEHFHDGILSRKHESIVKHQFLVFVAFEVIDCRHLEFALPLIEEDLVSEDLKRF
jgi:hypothetical protein